MKKATKKVAPAAKTRGADAQVPRKSRDPGLANEENRKLEQGLEESMAGSDPPSITQPTANMRKNPVQNTSRTQQDSQLQEAAGFFSQR